MKIGFTLSLLALVLVGFGCAPQSTVVPAASVPASEIETGAKAFFLESLDVDDVATIQKALASGAGLASVVKSDAWTILDGVDPMQMSGGVAWNDGQAVFGFVDQPSSWKPLWRASGTSLFGAPGDAAWTPVNFAGVLFSRDGGATWRRMFPIEPVSGQARDVGSLTPFNPVGMYVEDNRLWLDIADDSGAGSGEGVLVRYSSADGASWTKEAGCFYYLPEPNYDVPDHRYEAKSIDCPAYVSLLDEKDTEVFVKS